MNKNEFIDEINEKTGLSKRDCKLCLETMIEVIKSALQNGDSVTLSNFGKFKINNVKAKRLYNFQTKSTEVIDTKKIPMFKASEHLKQCVK